MLLWLSGRAQLILGGLLTVGSIVFTIAACASVDWQHWDTQTIGIEAGLWQTCFYDSETFAQWVCTKIVFNNPGFTFPGEKADYDGCRATIVLAILGLFGALSVEVLAFIHKLKARPALVISVAVTALAALFLAVTLGIYSKIFKEADGYATHGSGYTLAVFSCVWTALSALYFGVCFLMSKGFGDDGYASF